MKTKTKTFDCVEMKRRGAERIMAETRGMTFEEEVAYWRKRSEEFHAFLMKARQEAARSAEESSQDDGS